MSNWNAKKLEPQINFCIGGCVHLDCMQLVVYGKDWPANTCPAMTSVQQAAEPPPMPFVCQHAGCKTRFGQYFEQGEPSDAFGKILLGVVKSQQFCMKHCQMHTWIICRNGRITVES